MHFYKWMAPLLQPIYGSSIPFGNNKFVAENRDENFTETHVHPFRM